MNNLFKHAKKELSTDAFLAWFFVELDTNPKLNPYISSVFSSLGLVSYGELPENVEVKLQESRVDLLLFFDVGNEKRSILFENKVWTSFHSNQLEKYKKIFSNCTKYIYFKLGFIDIHEKLVIKQHGYLPLSAIDFYNAIKDLSSLDTIIQHYCEFIKHEFIDAIGNVLERIDQPDPNAFKNATVQKYIMGELYEKLKESDYSSEFKIIFKTGINRGGAPWTHLYICQKKGFYDGKNETLWWRIDKRSKKTYLRLSQYGNVKDRKDLIEIKKRRLGEIREAVNTICDNYALKRGKITNKGVNENEVVIFFFDENPYTKIKELLPALTRDIQNAYNNLID